MFFQNVDGSCELVKGEDLANLIGRDLPLRLLTEEDVAIIAIGDTETEAKEIHSQVFNIPYLDLDFSKVFPKVDLVIHHGMLNHRNGMK